jgi:hypothetical protein
MIRLILLDGLAEAVAAGRVTLTNLLPECDECQLLAALALLAALQGRLPRGTHHRPRRRHRYAHWKGRHVRFLLLRARLEPLLAGLAADKLASLRRKGAAMRDNGSSNQDWVTTCDPCR